MNPLKSKVSILRIGLLLPLTLSMWWLLLEPVITPLLKLLSGSILVYIFTYEGLQINDDSGLIWTMHTNFIFEGQANLSIVSFDMNFNSMTLGLPLLWLYCFNFYQRPQSLNILTGTLGLFLLLNLTIILRVSRQIYIMMAEDNITRQYLGIDHIVPIDLPSDILTQFLFLITPIFSYLVIVIFPAAFCYWANSDLILEALRRNTSRCSASPDKCYKRTII